jgi:hypothetical protein
MSSESDKVTNIEIACRQFGIKQQSKRPLTNSIKGINGITESINFLWEIVNFIKQLILFENLQDPHMKIQSDLKLLNYVCQNRDQIF